MLSAVGEIGLPMPAPKASAKASAEIPFAERMYRANASRNTSSLSLFTGELRDARSAAEEFVSLSLIQPILAQMRKSEWAAEPFSPGLTEQRFGPLLDGVISRRVVKASNFGLVDAVARHLRGAAQEARADAELQPRNLDSNA